MGEKPNWGMIWKRTKGVLKGIFFIGFGATMTQFDTPAVGPFDVAGGLLATKGLQDTFSSAGLILAGIEGYDDLNLDDTMAGTITNIATDDMKDENKKEMIRNTVDFIEGQIENVLTPDKTKLKNLPKEIKEIKNIYDNMDKVEKVYSGIKKVKKIKKEKSKRKDKK